MRENLAHEIDEKPRKKNKAAIEPAEYRQNLLTAQWRL
jgi:hypothetical protein